MNGSQHKLRVRVDQNNTSLIAEICHLNYCFGKKQQISVCKKNQYIYLLGTTLIKLHKPDLFGPIAITLSHMHQITTESLIVSQYQALALYLVKKNRKRPQHYQRLLQ